MPFDCTPRRRFGPDFCLTSCPVSVADGAFRFVRVERPDDLPPPSETVIDIALLDMHHGWPNLGHDAIVHAVQNAVCDIHERLDGAGLVVRLLSYDVRRGRMIPEAPPGRHGLYLGTGGPGHLDPSKNDGVSFGSQGINEDPSWEPRLFALFDRIRESDAALLGVCHTFGVMCRWLGVAGAELRGADKGGKSAGIVENLLTEEAKAHPWFGQLSAALPDHERLVALDNRLFDLLERRPLPADVTAIAYETLGPGGPRGDSLTMLEAARDRAGVMPRVLGVNHHPEIVNRQRQVVILKRKLARGNVTPEWFAERMRSMTEPIEDEWGDRLLHLTSSYTLMAPMRFYLYRLARERAEALGRDLPLHEESEPLTFSLASDRLAAGR